MKVAVVGAGAAGLCCARHLSKYQEYFQFQVLEKADEVGGTWVYAPITNPDNPVHSSMYKNLRVNLPKEVMFFPGFPFPSHLPSFISHREVLKYLQDYVSHYKLGQFIKCRSQVEEIKPIPIGFESEEQVVTQTTTQTNEINFHNWGKFKDNVKWKITVKDLESGEVTTENYDAVLICNGHYSEPYIPPIPGLTDFTGHVIHSHMYREPEVYKNQYVLVVGAGQSGRDICIDLSQHAKQVYLCNRGPRVLCPMPVNVEQLPGIDEFSSGQKIIVCFSNGQERFVDNVILATGYNYSFPFLANETGIKIKERKRVTPLYHHTFNSLHPSMAFIGINFGYNPLPYLDYQTRWVLSVWSGYKSLPSIEDMIGEEETRYQVRLQEGLPPHKASHYLGSAQWDMISLMATLGSIEPLAPVIEMLYNEVEQERAKNLLQYRNNNYVVLDRCKWELVKFE